MVPQLLTSFPNFMDSVLIVEADARRREMFLAVCQARGIQAQGVRDLGEIERWPVGGLVVTDLARLSSWWTSVGARHVVAVVASAAEGPEALANGATAWIRYDGDASALAAFIEAQMIATA